MMKKIYIFLFLLFIAIMLIGCATTNKGTTSRSERSSYVPAIEAISPRNITLAYPPENLKISYNEIDKSVNLFWKEMLDIKLYKGNYNIYRSFKEKELYMQVNSEPIKDIAFKDINVFPGDTYYYRITGILPNGNESPYSETIKITIPENKEKMLYDIETLSIDELTGNLLPIAETGEDLTTTINTPVVFSGTGKDRDGKIIKYEWDFDGNGTFDWSSSIDGKATYIYKEPKIYKAVFRVLDDKLASGLSEIRVTVYRCPKNMVEVEGKFCIDQYEYPNEPGVYPLININWDAAKKLCEQQEKRLCRSEEWEIACSGPNHLKYTYGNEFSPHKCRSNMNWEKGSAPSGSYKECVSDYGVYDMAGNVWEWTDKPGAIYYGGYWDSGAEDTQCSSKFGLNPTLYYNDLGFRCCKD